MADVSTVCTPHRCSGCMACVDACPVGAVDVCDEIEWMNSCIDMDKCVDCGLCRRVCQQINPVVLKPTISSYQGWAEKTIRERSSSGGLASAIAEAFIEAGGIVFSCVFEHGSFRFHAAFCKEEAEEFAGSKYVKSNPVGVYKFMANVLSDGKNALFVGLPCQVAAMKKYIKMRHLSDKDLYTIDLICHGTPSIKLLNLALRDYGYELDELKDVRFRSNHNMFGLRVNGKPVERANNMDSYTMTFLKGTCYTENCYSCYYAQRNRVGDLTLGDSWGTDLEKEEADGISLALVQTEKGAELLRSARISLSPVDYDNAVDHNKQLQHPSELTRERATLFSKLSEGCSFSTAVFASYPAYSIKRIIRNFLAHIGMQREIDN